MQRIVNKQAAYTHVRPLCKYEQTNICQMYPQKRHILTSPFGYIVIDIFEKNDITFGVELDFME